MRYFAHESAVIDAPVSIGDETKIWHFTHICANCTIGPNCNIGQNVMVGTGVSIGSNVKIQNNVSVYSGILIEDDVFLGPSCVFTNVSNPRSQISRRELYEETVVRRGANNRRKCDDYLRNIPRPLLLCSGRCGGNEGCGGLLSNGGGAGKESRMDESPWPPTHFRFEGNARLSGERFSICGGISRYTPLSGS